MTVNYSRSSGSPKLGQVCMTPSARYAIRLYKGPMADLVGKMSPAIKMLTQCANVQTVKTKVYELDDALPEEVEAFVYTATVFLSLFGVARGGEVQNNCLDLLLTEVEKYLVKANQLENIQAEPIE